MRVSKSYENYDRIGNPFEKNNKLYTKVRTVCPRCSGKGVIISRIENGRPIPVQPDAGICYSCGGKKYIEKEVRLYTDEEFEKKEAAAAKAKEKREVARQAKIEAEFETKRSQWLSQNGFNENLTTYVYFPRDSFEVKDTLKELGFRFNNSLLWHIAEIPEGYEDKVVEINFKDVAQMSAWGTGTYFSDARTKVDAAIKQALPPIYSSWLGEVGDRIKSVKATVLSIRGFEGYYGYVRIITFSIDNSIAKWFCSTPKFQNEPGDEVLLTGTIKDNIIDKYEDGAQVSILTRCKVEEVA